MALFSSVVRVVLTSKITLSIASVTYTLESWGMQLSNCSFLYLMFSLGFSSFSYTSLWVPIIIMLDLPPDSSPWHISLKTSAVVSVAR